MVLLIVVSFLFIVALLLGISPEALAIINSSGIRLRGADNSDITKQGYAPRWLSRGRRTPHLRWKKRNRHKRSSRSTSSMPCTAANEKHDCPYRHHCYLDFDSNFDLDSCNPFAQGFCKSTSPRCTREYRPVCGCNGASYSNSCLARWGQASKGMQAGIKHRGNCERVMP